MCTILGKCQCQLHKVPLCILKSIKAFLEKSFWAMIIYSVAQVLSDVVSSQIFGWREFMRWDDYVYQNVCHRSSAERRECINWGDHVQGCLVLPSAEKLCAVLLHSSVISLALPDICCWHLALYNNSSGETAQWLLASHRQYYFWGDNVTVWALKHHPLFKLPVKWLSLATSFRLPRTECCT